MQLVPKPQSSLASFALPAQICQASKPAIQSHAACSSRKKPGSLASSSPACLACPAASPAHPFSQTASLSNPCQTARLMSQSSLPWLPDRKSKAAWLSLPDMPDWPVMLECLADLNNDGKARLAKTRSLVARIARLAGDEQGRRASPANPAALPDMPGCQPC